jgi:hypothetical protein
MTLPHGYKPNFSQRQALEAPYKLPNRDQLLSLGPGRTLHVSIPPLQEKNIQVRPPEVSPYMDMNEGSIASTMVAAGLQPSEIAEEYQANWSPEKVSRDILQNFFDSHGQTLEGVRIEVQRLATSGKNINTDSHPAFRVKIYGRGQYAFEKAYVLGDSDKQEDDVNAGGFRRPENHRTQLSSGLWCTLCQNVFCQLGNDLYAARRTRVRRKYTPII